MDTEVQIDIGWKNTGIIKLAAKELKSILPRLSDVAFDISSLQKMKKLLNLSDVEIEGMVLDALDVFWIIPFNPGDRKYFVALVDGVYCVYLWIAQGSVGGPFAWAAVFGLITCCAESTKYFPELRRQTSTVEVYVGDLLMCTVGTPRERRQQFAMVIVTWLAFRVPLSFKNGQMGRKLNWIDWCVEVLPNGSRVIINEERMAEFRELMTSLLSANVVSKKKLSSYIGNAQSTSGVCHVWQPFFAGLFAA